MFSKKWMVCLGILALMFAFGVDTVNAHRGILNPLRNPQPDYHLDVQTDPADGVVHRHASTTSAARIVVTVGGGGGQVSSGIVLPLLPPRQRVVSRPNIKPSSGTLGANKFIVYEMKNPGGNNSYSNGIFETGADAVTQVQASTNNGTEFPDIYDLLRLGGTIELALRVGEKGASNYTVVSDADGSARDSQRAITAAQAAKFAYRLVISEVMWGLDKSHTGGAQALGQWIEIYNNGAALKSDDELILLFSQISPDWRSGDVERPARGNRVGQVAYVPDLDGDGYNANFDRQDAEAGETFVVVDMISTIGKFGGPWTLKGNSGNTSVIRSGTTITPPTDLVSMYRKINLDGNKYKANSGAKIDGLTSGLDGMGHGAEPGAWEKSTARRNISGYNIGSPGAVHATIGGIAGLAKGFGKAPGSISSTGVILNEVRNDSSRSNLDWVELYYNNDAAGATPQNLENWTLSIVTRTVKADKKETDAPTGTNFTYADENLFSLPKYKLQPGEYLVIYNRHPEDTALAGGVNIEDVLAGKQVNKGSKHLYIVREGLNLPSDKKFLLVLRNGNDKKGTHEKVVDYAGNGFFRRVETNAFNTDVWPLIGWNAPGDVEPFGDNTFASAEQSFGRIADLTDKGVARPKSRNDNRTHKDDWQAFGFTGAGYDRDASPATSPGTPGYENRVVNIVHDDRDGAAGKSAYSFGGTITVSEIMSDAGPRWNLVQWIELYNSSQTETVNIGGWTMEIRNESTDVESYVDSSFKFNADTEILPNQTLLLVSGSGANDVPQGRVYNLYEHHRRELGLVARDSRLLSREGFYIRLTGKIMEGGREIDIDDLNANDIGKILMDEVGNVAVDGAARNHMWDLPARDSDVRHSLVRQYGSRVIDGSRDMANDGTMETSWKVSDISGAALTFYGHRNDIGTPGFRLGGPLPVSLSSFRPVRDAATGNVVVRWITQSELNNAGFNILRSESRKGEFTVVNVKGIIPGHGTTSEKHLYEWTDTTAKPNVVYYYQIEDVSLDGKRTTLTTTRLKGHVSASGKLTTTWANLKGQAQ